MTLCALNCLELQARVTSTNSSSSWRLRSARATEWGKSSQLRLSREEEAASSESEDEEAAVESAP